MAMEVLRNGLVHVGLPAVGYPRPAGTPTDGRDWVDDVLSRNNFEAALQRMRQDQSPGYDGWRGVTLKWAPEWMRALPPDLARRGAQPPVAGELAALARQHDRKAR